MKNSPVRTSPFDPPDADFRRVAAFGALHTAAAQVVKFLLRIGTIVILSRMVAPSEFGIMAMAAPVLAFALMLQEMGLTQATVQRSDLTPKQASGLFWLNLGVSAGTAALVAACAVPIAAFYGQARVAPLVVALAITIIVSALGMQHAALLNRQMRFQAIALIDIASALANLAVAIAAVLVTETYWALFAGLAASAGVSTVGAWVAVRWTPSAPHRSVLDRSMLNFGAGVTGFNLANYFARNSDNVLIGKQWGDDALGLYDRAYKLLLFPLQQINRPIAKVMLPLLSKVREEPERYRRAYLRSTGMLMLATVPGVAFMIGTADRLIPTVLGHQWGAAAPIFAALGVAALLQPINNTMGWLFMSQSRTRDFMLWGIFGAVTSIAAFLIGLPWGPFGVACAYAASEFARTPLLWWVVTRTGPLRFLDIALSAMPHLVGAACSLGVLWALRSATDWPAWIDLSASAALSYAVAFAVVALFPRGREVFVECRKMANILLHKRKSPEERL